MKILHVLNELRPSGAETMLRLAATRWLDRGLELDVVSLGETVGTYAETLAEAGYRVHHIPFHPIGAFLASFRRLLRDGRYDAVHVHPERANFVLAAMGVAVGHAGVIRTVHNVFAFDGRLRLERRVQRAALRGLGVIHVAIGESVAASEMERFGNRTVRVHNTFDEVRFSRPTSADRASARGRFGFDAGDFVVAVVGNCSPVKNHAVLIEALARPDARQAHLLHVGLENEDVTGERRLAQESGLGERAWFLGFVDDVTSVLHAADCVVMPSLYEGLSIAALETLGCGVPSVLAEVPGLQDLRQHVPGIWWVQPRPEPIAEALAEVAALDSATRQRWSEVAASAVRQQFGVERHVSAYHRLYERVSAKGRLR